MVHDIKKQIWMTNDEDEQLQKLAQKCCLTESEYLRMLLRGYVPKEKPGIEFYEIMNQLNQFSEQLQNLVLHENYSANILQEEVDRWHEFQLAVEERFLAPEKVPWL